MFTQRHEEVKGLYRETNRFRFGFGLNIHYFGYITSECGISNISAHVKDWTFKTQTGFSKVWDRLLFLPLILCLQRNFLF